MRYSKIVLTRKPSRRTCEANAAGEIAHSFLQSCVKSVPLYNLKLAYVDLHTAVEEFSKTTSKNGETGHFNLESHF